MLARFVEKATLCTNREHRSEEFLMKVWKRRSIYEMTVCLQDEINTGLTKGCRPKMRCNEGPGDHDAVKVEI